MTALQREGLDRLCERKYWLMREIVKKVVDCQDVSQPREEFIKLEAELTALKKEMEDEENVFMELF